MLLPQPDRRRAPFLVSLVMQISFVLLLAIPWTVQTLRSSAFQLPVVLHLEALKPAVPVVHAQSKGSGSTALTIPTAVRRVFRMPSVVSSSTTANAMTDAPEISFDPRVPLGLGDGARLTDVTVRTGANLNIPPELPTKTETPPRVIIVGGSVQAAKLIHQVQPVYPYLARTTRVQGVVTLEAVIGVDGSIQQLHLVRGHPLLTQSAIQAVQQWKYSPTVLNGKAVEVRTTIEVRFTLS